MLNHEMAAGHAQDYEDKDRMDALRHTIGAFLACPPARVKPWTRERLQKVETDLAEASATVVEVWE